MRLVKSLALVYFQAWVGFCLLNPLLFKATAWANEPASPLVTPLSQLLEASPTPPRPLEAYLAKTETLPLDLATVLALTENQSLPLEQQQLGVKLASNRLGLAVANLLPDVALSYSQNSFNGGIQIFGAQVINIERKTVEPQISAVWQINPAGRDILVALAAKRNKTAQKATLEQTRQQQLARAATTYYNLLAAQLKTQVAQQALKTAQEQLRLAKARLEAGISPKLDWVRAQALVANFELTVAQTQTQAAQAEQQLIEVLNIEHAVSFEPALTDAVQRRLLAPATSVEALYEKLLQSHPLVQQAQAQVNQARASYQASYANIVPDLTLQAYANRVGPNLSNTTGGHFTGLTLQLNALNGLGATTYFQIQERRTQLAQAELALKQARRQLESQLGQAMVGIRQQEVAIETAQVALVANEEGFRLSQGRYQAGVGTQLDVLVAQRDLLTTREQVIDAIIGFDNAQIQALLAVGVLSQQTLLQGWTL